MLVQVSGSVSCRGWENNSSDLVETKLSLKEYIIQEVLMEEWEMSREESESQLEESDDWGGWSFEFGSWNYEGEENTISYSEFKPSRDYLNMIRRNTI